MQSSLMRVIRLSMVWFLIGLVGMSYSAVRAQDLFVTSFARNHPVERFNGTTGAYVSSLDPANDLSDTAGTPGYTYRYTGLTFDPSGSIYFSNFVDRSQPPYKDDGVDRYNVATGKFEVFSTFGTSDPYGLVFGGQNRNLFVACQYAQGSPGVYGGILQYFKGFGNYTLDFNFFSQVTDPYDITFGPDNNIYVSSNTSGTVERYDGSSGAYIGTFSQVSTPVGLTFGPDGNLYVSSYGGNAVQKFDGKTGAFIGNFAAINNPTGLTFGPDGNLYVASWASNTIEHFDGKTGASLGTFASTGLDHPFGVAFAPAGAGTNFPRVSLTSPNDNDIFSAPGTITITAAASDSYGTISKVEFFSGATKIGQATAAPYTFVWPNVATGTYTLTAKATNDAGAVATSSPISVTVFTPVSSLKINCGGGDYNSATTGLWQADTDFTGGSTYTYPQSSVVGTSDPGLFDSVRYDPSGFGYRLPVGPGSYTLTLYFMEGDRTAPGQRVFNVSVNGSPLLTNFDVYKEAGGQGIALAKSFPITVGANGIPIDFQAYANNAMISAIEVEPSGPPAVPPAPSGLSASAGDRQVALAWSASAGAATYSVYRGTAAGAEGAAPVATGVTGTSYTDAGLADGTAYYYRVTATDGAGESGPSNEASATPAPAPASVLQINCGGGVYTSASSGAWQADADFTGGSAYTFPTAVSGTSDPALFQAVRYDSTAFSYQLSVPAGSYTLKLYFVEGDRTAPGQRVFSVSANGSPLLTSFDVFQDAGGQGIADVKSFPVTAGANGLSLVFRSVVLNAMVSAIQLIPSGPPAVPPAPSGLSASAGDRQVALAWSASAGAATYSVYRGTAAGAEGAAPVATGVTGTSYTDAGLADGTAYYYRVTATDGAGESGPSNEASATPASAPASVLQINCGGGVYTSASSGAWQADADFTGGSAYTFPTAVSGTSDPALFQAVRYDPTGFSYHLPASAGSYTLNLYFVEGDRTAAGQRVFNVSVNGSPVLANFDVFKQAGGQGKALVQSLPVTAGANGVTVSFQAVVTNAMVSAIQLVPAGSSGTLLAPATLNATPGNGQVSLTWSKVSIGTGYNLYRSTFLGGPYTSLATGLTTTNYTDSSVSNGTNYYYVVTAVNGSAESGYSNQAWAMPTAATTPLIKIMPLGDSITGYNTSYRRPLWQMLQSGGYGVDFVGSQVTQPVNGGVIDYDPDNEGHPGYRTDQILSSVGLWADTYQPNIVLLHIGTNDLLQGVAISTILSNMGQIIDQLRTGNPSVKILLAQIIPISGSTTVQDLNAQIPGLVAQKTTAQSPVMVVDQFTGYDPSTDSADGVHPNDSGTEKMAEKWFAALQSLLATIPPAPSGLSASAGDRQVALAWSASAGAATYSVYRGTAAGAEGAAPVATGVTGTSYTDAGLADGTAYYYRVTATDGAGESGPSNEASATPASAPASVLQINCGGGVYTSASSGAWQADADFTGGSAYTFPTAVSGTSDPALFQAVRYDPTGFSYHLPASAGSYTLNLYFVEGDRTAAGQRVFNVSVNGSPVLANFDVFKQAGGQGKALVQSLPVTAGANGVTVSFQAVVTNAMVSAIQLIPSGPPAVPPAPSGLSASAGDRQVALAWSASAGAATYSVYRGTAAGAEGAAPVATGVTGTSYTDAGLADGTAYYYRVTATDGAGESGPSNEASATPASAPASVLQINCGGGVYTSASSGAWQADADFTGGYTYTFPNAVSGTSDPALFQAVRYDPTGFSYHLPASAGSYTLKLYFVEGDKTGPGQRVFNVSANGSPLLTNFDVFQDAGGQGIADVKSFPVTAGANGVTVSFQAVVTNAMVSAIQLVPR